jgi:acetate---CoA ligase (ADP-forming)
VLDPLFRPKSVAVIGASNRPLTIGNRIVQNLLDMGFTGTISPINPKDAVICDLPAYPSVLEVPGEVDLVHVIVKNTQVPGVLADCGAKGIRVAIVNTSGFKEVGPEGAELEREIVRVARQHGVRIFGPNCQGVMNTDPEVRAYCNFTFTRLIPGHISLVAQSGGVGEVINNRLYELQAGIRMYASNGNACDISIPEILAYWADDPQTRVIVCHVESLADPAEFLRVAREVSRVKPILGLKTGRTLEGSKAVSSHTGGMIRQDTKTELVFEEAGVVSFRDQLELCDAAYAFARQPVPAGNRVGIVTNAGGPGIVATDEVIEAGCELPELAETTQARLRAALFDEAIVSNPIDTLATGRPEHYREVVTALLEDVNVDSILVNFITPFFVDCEAVAREIAALAPGAPKPIIGVVMTRKEGWAPTLAIFRDAGIPVFDFPETGARALGAMVRYAERRRRPDESPADFDDIDRECAAELVASVGASGGGYLPQATAFALLGCYGIGSPPIEQARSLGETLAAADRIGYPVVLKVDSELLVHKSDAGGVALGLHGSDELAAAFRDMSDRLGARADRFVVAGFVERSGVEVILGAKREEGLGHLVMFGLGGVLVELLGDVTFGIAPLGAGRAREVIRGIRALPVLEGVRGLPPVDIDRLAVMLCRLGRLVTDNPTIIELDLNPVFAFGADRPPLAVDARIKIG